MADEYIPEKVNLKVFGSPTVLAYYPSENGRGPRINVIHLGDDSDLEDAAAYICMSAGRFPDYAVNTLWECLVEADKKKELTLDFFAMQVKSKLKPLLKTA